MIPMTPNGTEIFEIFKPFGLSHLLRTLLRGSSNFVISIRPSIIELILFLSNDSLSINEFDIDFFWLFSISILFASKI